MQEQIHHQEYQDDGFDQRFHHFVNRDFNERRGVVRINHFHPLREERLHFGQRVFHTLSGVQGVGTGSQFDTQACRRFAVITCGHRIAFSSALNVCHVAQANLRTVGIHLQQNFAELFWRGQTGLRDDRGVKLLTRHRWHPTQLPCGDLVVLLGNGGRHISSG
ncbi:hypothetical protein D3C73_1087040 [compost metagenome]